MHTSEPKSQKKENTADFRELAQARSDGSGAFAFIDHRPDTVMQQKLQAMAEHSPRTQQAAQLKNMLDGAEPPRSIQKRIKPALQMKTGASGPASDVLQLRTNIRHWHGTAEYGGKSGPVGLEMKANLDPADEVVGSAVDSANDGASDALYGRVAALNPKKYARGHLLNHDLGGYGVNENLYPISAGANARHSMIVEQKVKRYLVEAAKFNDGKPPTTKKGVAYEVKVRGTPLSSQFDCNWKYESIGTKAIPKFDPEAGAALIESQLNNTDAYSFAGHAVGLDKWSHGKRKGKEDMAAEVKAEHIELHAGAQPGALRHARYVTALTPEQIAEQKAWAAKNPKGLSPEDEAYYAEREEKQRQEEEAAKARLEAEGRVTRSMDAPTAMEDDSDG